MRGMPLALRQRHGTARLLGDLPARLDHAHATHALDRLDEVHPAQNGPPAVTRMLHPAQAFVPGLAAQARAVAAKAPSIHLQIEQAQPVTQAAMPDQVVDIRNEGRRATAHALCQHAAPLLCAPQADRIESDHDQAPFRHQHTLHFTQGGVRVGTGFQRMGQHHQIQAVFGKRQCHGLDHQTQGNLPFVRQITGADLGIQLISQCGIHLLRHFHRQAMIGCQCRLRRVDAGQPAPLDAAVA